MFTLREVRDLKAKVAGHCDKPSYRGAPLLKIIYIFNEEFNFNKSFRVKQEPIHGFYDYRI